MRHCYADSLAAILEYKYIFDVFVSFDSVKTLNPQINQLADMVNGQLGQSNRMIRRVEYYLAFAVCRLYLKKVGRNIIGRRRILRERRKIVVIFVYIEVVGNFARARTKRTPVFGHLRPVLTVRRYHYPVLD